MKRVLLITYDLNKPGQDYKSLFEAIKALGAWWHHLDSTWIVVSSKTPAQAWTSLAPTLDQSDHCLIIDITGDTYNGWLPKQAWDWMRSNVDQPAWR